MSFDTMNWTEVGQKAEKITWSGENEGDFIWGVVEDIKQVTRKDGTEGTVMTIVNEEIKESYSVWPKSQLLRLITEANLQPGTMVKVEYTGKQKLKTDKTKSFRSYKLYVASE